MVSGPTSRRRRQSRTPPRLARIVPSCAAAVALGAVLVSARTPDPGYKGSIRGLSAASGDQDAAVPARQRVREGTQLVDQAGHFRPTGDRITFFTADGNDRFVVLENLNLERVARLIAEGPERRAWRASGTITEYRGTNFLLLGQAVLTNRGQLRDISGFNPGFQSGSLTPVLVGL